MVKNPPRELSSIPGQGTKIAQTSWQPSLGTVTTETASCGAHAPQPEKASGPRQKPSTAKKEKGSPGDSDVQSRLKSYTLDFINHRPGLPEFIISVSLYLLSGSS